MGAQGSKPPKVTSQDRAILDLKLQRDRIRQYQKKLVVVEDREKAAAKELLARGDKARALSALRRGKYQRSILEKTEGQLRTLEELVSSIEFSQIQASVYHGLEQGNRVLKELHKELNPEAVERLLDETAEAQAKQREVDDLLASRMTPEEEEQVQAEMAALEREARGVSQPQRAGEEGEQQQQHLPEMPEAPTAEPQERLGEEQEEQPRRTEKREEEPEARQAVLA